jgi:hypothetical protein
MADAQPAPADGAQAGEPPAQQNAAAITAALVQATEARMNLMRQQMEAAGHTPPGV